MKAASSREFIGWVSIPGDFDEIIFEVLASDETQTRYKANQEAGFPDLAPLRAWTGLRAPG